MGRGKKPLAMQKGNLTVEQQNKMIAAEETIKVGKEHLNKAPPWLKDNIAKKEFERIVKEFEKIDVVGNLDLNNIGAYCNAFSDYVETTKLLKKSSKIVKKINKKGEKTDEPNPLIKLQRDYAKEMREFGRTFGLTVDSRLKVAVVQTTKTEEEIDSKFGDI